VHVLDAAAIRRRERLHAAVRVEAPSARGDRAVPGDVGELAGGVVAEGLGIEADGGVWAGLVVAEDSAGVLEQVAVVAVAPGLGLARGGVADEAAQVVVDESLGEREVFGGEVVAGLGELAGGVVAVREVEERARAGGDALAVDAAAVVEVAV
jgi:hypothetical protein